MPQQTAINDIGLVGINACETSQAIQPTIYGSQFPLETGFHLRWQLRAGLGLPERFMIYKTNEAFFKTTYNPDWEGGINLNNQKPENELLVLLKTDIESLVYVDLGHNTQYASPAFTLHYGKWNALEWLTDANQERGTTPSPLTTALTAKYQSTKSVPDLTALIRNLQTTAKTGQRVGMDTIYAMHQQVIEQPDHNAFKTSLKRMDILNIGALDPHIARMAGFYFIDREVRERSKYKTGYFVVADYSGQDAPFNVVTPTKEALVSSNIASEMRFESFKVIAIDGSYLTFSNTNHSEFLTVLSSEKPAIRFVFDELNGIDQAIIAVKTNIIAPDFFIAMDGVYGHGVIIEEVTPIGSGNWLITASGRFHNLEIKAISRGSLIITQVQFKNRRDFIVSNPIILGGGTGEEKVQPLSLGRVLTEPAAPVLDDNGAYNPFKSSIKLSLVNKAEPIDPAHPHIIAANSPIKAIFERTNINTGGPSQNSDSTIIRRNNRVLPELQFYAPLVATAKDFATGQSLVFFGKSRFVKDSPLDKKFKSLLIADNGGAYVGEGTFFIKETFTIALWLKIKPGNVENQHIPLVSFGGEQGVSFGLRQTNGAFFLRLKVGGQTVEARTAAITAQNVNKWLTLRADFNGGFVSFNLNTELLQINSRSIPFTMGGIAIGMDFNPETNQPVRSFKGQICDVQIWNRLIDVGEAAQLLSDNSSAFPQLLLPKSLYRLKEVLSFDANTPLYSRIIYGINTLNTGFSIQFWLKIERGDSAVILCDSSGGFRFAVNYMDGICRWENSHTGFQMNADVTPVHGEWTHIVFSQDANKLFKFFVNGRLIQESQSAAYLVSNIFQPLFFGSEPDGNAKLEGKIANFRLYPAPFDPIQTKQAFAVNQLLESNIDESRYQFRAKGIDLFGRMSEFGPAIAHWVKSNYRPNPPAGLKAEILTYTVNLISAVLQTPAVPTDTTAARNKPFWNTQVQPIPSFDFAVLKRHSITITGTKQASTSLVDKTPTSKQVSQKYEVKDSTDNSLLLKDVPFTQIKPDQTTPQQTVFIEYDGQVRLRWEWTGLQQVFNPGVTQFQIFQYAGLINNLHGSVTSVETIDNDINKHFRVRANINLSGDADELKDNFCLIDYRAYLIAGHTTDGQETIFELRYDNSPRIIPTVGAVFMLTIPETHSAWLDFTKTENWTLTGAPEPVQLVERKVFSNLLSIRKADSIGTLPQLLRDNKIDWFPIETAWQLRVNQETMPSGYSQLPPSLYVPSAIVVNCKGVWKVWYVVWHNWKAQELDLYITVADDNMTDASVSPLDLLDQFKPIYFYEGKAFNRELLIIPPTDSEPPTLSYHFAVAAQTAQATGALSIKASVVAVNRRLPIESPAPRIRDISLADVHGNSEAHINWDNPGGVYGYNLYRATDSAIFEKDLENRRLGLGFYENKDNVFAEDNDIDEFLPVIQLKTANTFIPDFESAFGIRLQNIIIPETQTRLQVLLSYLSGRDKDKYGAKWNALTPIWQYWADRFYPACSPTEKMAIANRNGNETAFTLVNTEPICKNDYTDVVNGVVSNQYFYRLRTVGANMALGSTWSPASNGMGVSVPASRPRTPVWTKVEAGDRQATLQWALNREPDFKEYILYRAMDADLLKDLRWAEVQQPEGLVIRRIRDPRILTSLDTDGNSVIVFSEGQIPPPIAAILGIYRAFEFDNKIQGVQIGAMNLLQASTQIVGNTIHNIRKVAKNTEGVIVWRNAAGLVQVMTSFGNWPFVNRELLGLTTYFYKLVAKNVQNIVCGGGEMQSVKALEIEPPPPPVIFSSNRIIGTQYDTVRLQINCESGLEIMIQQKKLGDLAWTTVLDWNTQNMLFIFEQQVSRNSTFSFKVWSRTHNKLVCVYPSMSHFNNTIQI